MSEPETFQIHPASRGKIIPIMGFFGVSGGGKTLSALLFMRGFIGPKGKLGIIDTEKRRSEIFSDQVPGGFDVISLDPPFSPDRFKAAMQTFLDQKYDGMVVDCASHEWIGDGGYLSMKYDEALRMADGNLRRINQFNMPASGKLKPIHDRFVSFCCRLPIPCILCFRSKTKVHAVKEMDEQSKREFTTWQADDYMTPIQESGFVWEMLISGELRKGVHEKGEKAGIEEGGFWDGRGVAKKHTHPDVLKIMPQEGIQITMEHGAALARWCDAGQAPQAPSRAALTPLRELKAQLWELTRSVHGCKKGDKDAALLADGVRKLNQWMVDEIICSDTESWETLTAERLPEIITKATEKLKGKTT